MINDFKRILSALYFDKILLMVYKWSIDRKLFFKYRWNLAFCENMPECLAFQGGELHYSTKGRVDRHEDT